MQGKHGWDCGTDSDPTRRQSGGEVLADPSGPSSYDTLDEVTIRWRYIGSLADAYPSGRGRGRALAMTRTDFKLEALKGHLKLTNFDIRPAESSSESLRPGNLKRHGGRPESMGPPGAGRQLVCISVLPKSCFFAKLSLKWLSLKRLNLAKPVGPHLWVASFKFRLLLLPSSEHLPLITQVSDVSGLGSHCRGPALWRPRAAAGQGPENSPGKLEALTTMHNWWAASNIPVAILCSFKSSSSGVCHYCFLN